MDVVLDIGEKIIEAAVCIYCWVFQLRRLSRIEGTLLLLLQWKLKSFWNIFDSVLFVPMIGCLSSELVSNNLRFLVKG